MLGDFIVNKRRWDCYQNETMPKNVELMNVAHIAVENANKQIEANRKNIVIRDHSSKGIY